MTLKSWSEYSAWVLYPHLMFLIKPEGERRKQGVGEESELCSPIYYLDSLRLKKKKVFEKHESNFLSDNHERLRNNFVPVALKLQQHLVKDLLIYLQSLKCYIF